MTLHLILDENVIEFAAKLQDEDGNLDNTCLALINDIIKRCDSMYCTDELLKNYSEKLKALETKFHGAYTVTKLLVLAQKHGKIKVRGSAPSLPNEKDIPDDDRYLIRFAVITGHTLVSADGRLKVKLDESKLTEKHGIKIKHPKDI